MNKSEKFWDRSAKGYENREIKWENIYNKAVEKTIPYLKDSHILLEYGCGAGVITAQLAEHVKEVDAIDISSKMLEAAERIAQDRKLTNIRFKKTTILDTKFKKESFDVITAFNLLHLLDDLEEETRRIHSLLKPGGLFITETPCLGEEKSITGGVLKLLSKLKIVPKINQLKFSDINQILEQSNFKILETEDLEQNSRNYYIVSQKSLN